MRSVKITKGSVLLATIVILSISAFVAVSLLKYAIALGRLDQRRNDGVVAFYIAESGVNKVVHYFNHPEAYTPDPTLFAYNENDDDYTNMLNALESGSVVIPEFERPVFKVANGNQLGKVIELTLIPSSPSDTVPCLAKIKSVGRTETGIIKTVYLYIFALDNPAATSPAALVSRDGVSAFNGNASARWGEIWCNGPNTQITGSNQWNNYIDLRDPGWTNFRITGEFQMNNGNYLDGTRQGSVLPLTPAAGPRYYNPNLARCQMSQYDGRLLQHQNLDFPVYDYNTFKTIALQRGEYYSTDINGNIYRDGIEDTAHIVDYYTEFCQADPVNGSNRFVFIDTADGTEPKPDESNLADISLSGTSPHSKGIYYIGGNLKIAGLGNPPDVTVKDPNKEDVTVNKLFHNGLIYVAGDLNVTGNPNIYGSLVVERQIEGSGTPMVYYNVDLRNNILFPVDSRVRVRLFKVD